MIKLRSICQAVNDIKTNDPNTAMTEALLKQLVANGDITSNYSGCRVCLDMEKLPQELSELFELETTDIPKLRTVREAVKEIKSYDMFSFITEYQIRLWLKENRLHSLAVGSRQIVALDEFDYSKIMAAPKKKERNKTQFQKLSQQFNSILENTTQGYVCQRKR